MYCILYFTWRPTIIFVCEYVCSLYIQLPTVYYASPFYGFHRSQSRVSRLPSLVLLQVGFAMKKWRTFVISPPAFPFPHTHTLSFSIITGFPPVQTPWHLILEIMTLVIFFQFFSCTFYENKMIIPFPLPAT